MDFSFQIRVQCYSGYRGEEKPTRFFLGDRAVEIREITDMWLSPDHRYFKVIGDDGATYILRCDMETFSWELTFFKKYGLVIKDLGNFGGAGVPPAHRK